MQYFTPLHGVKCGNFDETDAKHMNKTLEVPGFDWRRSAAPSYVLYLNNFSKE